MPCVARGSLGAGRRGPSGESPCSSRSPSRRSCASSATTRPTQGGRGCGSHGGPTRLAADLRRLRSLNANTVRVVVSPPFFGYPEPEPKYARPAGRARLDRGRGGPARAADAVRLVGGVPRRRRVEAMGERVARAVRRRSAGSPSSSSATRSTRPTRTRVAWARELVPWLRTLLGRRTPVTLSVRATDPARDLRALARRAAGGVASRLLRRALLHGRRRARGGRLPAVAHGGGADAGLGRGARLPTSTTVSGFDGVALTRSAQEAAQTHYLRLCFAAARRLGLPDPGIWILDDFAAGAIPFSDVSPKEPEYNFGLFRTDRTEKKAAATLRRLFSRRA